ncbi:ABC transporter substrate-binding protein [uncultured Pelagimonas sp.]|uniref:ABC transporter substrate-binding protein n=1 Tax=uncultured Pelagimonas sp. TaxID=1618102 RepID=UPI002631F2B4|nr:ABC transporter substrate-binding protein [uncultured Pelagimonas sp.]
MKSKIMGLVLATTALTGAAQAAELRMSWWGGDSRHAATQEALKVCGEKHGHTIKPEFTGWSGHYEKLTTQIAGGTEADIMQVNWPWLSIYSSDGSGLADLNELSDIIDLSSWDAAQIEAGSMNGKLNGLPISTTGRLFVFNKTTYAKAGLDIPNTWDELLAAGPVFKEKLGDDYFPFEGAKLDAALLMTIYGTQKTGKALINPDTHKLEWTKEELADAIQFYKTMVDNHVIPAWKDVAAAGNVRLHENPLWADGHIAGTYQWDSTYFKITKPLNDDQEVVYHGLLSQDGQATPGIYRKASMVFSISANSPNKEAAAHIVNCMLNESEGVAAMGTARGVPASTAARDQLLSADAIKQVQIDAQAKVIQAEGPAIHPMMEFPDVRSALQDNLELFAYGEVDAATAADDMIYAIEEALADIAD